MNKTKTLWSNFFPTLFSHLLDAAPSSNPMSLSSVLAFTEANRMASAISCSATCCPLTFSRASFHPRSSSWHLQATYSAILQGKKWFSYIGIVSLYQSEPLLRYVCRPITDIGGILLLFCISSHWEIFLSLWQSLIYNGIHIWTVVRINIGSKYQPYLDLYLVWICIWFWSRSAHEHREKE